MKYYSLLNPNLQKMLIENQEPCGDLRCKFCYSRNKLKDCGMHYYGTNKIDSELSLPMCEILNIARNCEEFEIMFGYN